MPLFDVSVARIYVIFDEFLRWILTALEFPLLGYLENENWDAQAIGG